MADESASIQIISDKMTAPRGHVSCFTVTIRPTVNIISQGLA